MMPSVPAIAGAAHARSAGRGRRTRSQRARVACERLGDRRGQRLGPGRRRLLLELDLQQRAAGDLLEESVKRCGQSPAALPSSGVCVSSATVRLSERPVTAGQPLEIVVVEDDGTPSLESCRSHSMAIAARRSPPRRPSALFSMTPSARSCRPRWAIGRSKRGGHDAPQCRLRRWPRFRRRRRAAGRRRRTRRGRACPCRRARRR